MKGKLLATGWEGVSDPSTQDGAFYMVFLAAFERDLVMLEMLWEGSSAWFRQTLRPQTTAALLGTLRSSAS